MSISTLPTVQAWRRDTVAPASWYERLPERLLDSLDNQLRLPSEDLTTVRLPEEVFPLCKEALRPAADALESGAGFVVMQAPARDYDERQLTLLYWLVGQALGRPVAQNVQGKLLYDVCDTGQDVRYGARFSITSAESSFHTDASFCDDLVD